MARTTYSVGPGLIISGTTSIRTKGNIKITEIIETVPIEVAYSGGKVDERATNRYAEITFQPAGEIETADLAFLYPHAAKTFGADLFPAVDVALTVLGSDGTSQTYSAYAVTKMPSLNLGVENDVFGECTIRCLGTGDTAWSTASSLCTALESGATDASTDTFAVSDIIRAPAYLTWGSTFVALNTIDGIKIDFNMGTFDKKNDLYGIQNMGISSFEATASFKPVGVTATALRTAGKIQGSGSARGMSMVTSSPVNLVCTMGTTPKLVTATLMGSFIKNYDLVYGVQDPRINNIQMAAGSTSATPTIGSYFTIAVS
jgi:hypothetical protein